MLCVYSVYALRMLMGGYYIEAIPVVYRYSAQGIRLQLSYHSGAIPVPVLYGSVIF